MNRSTMHARRALSLGALAALFVIALVLVPLAVRANHAVPASAPLPTLTPVPAEPQTVFVGGASAAGAGASKANERWTTLASKTLGWREVNLARAGSGFGVGAPDGCGSKSGCTLEGLINEVASAGPKVVVVAGDASTFDPADPKSATEVLTFFRALRQALPDARIIAVGPWSADGKPPAAVAALDKSVSSAVGAVRGVYVSLLSPALVERDMTTRNGSLLNDIGHQAVADRVIATLDTSEN